MSARALCQGDSGGHTCSLWLLAPCQAFCALSLPSQSSQFTSTCLDCYCAISPLSLATHWLDQNKARAKFKQMVAVLFIPFFSLFFMYYHKSHNQIFLSAQLCLHYSCQWSSSSLTPLDSTGHKPLQLGTEQRHFGIIYLARDEKENLFHINEMRYKVPYSSMGR